MTKPFIMVAPNGARRGKTDHAALPITAGEIAETAHSCHVAGADGLHLHVRDDQGAHSLDAGRYREAIDEVTRLVPDMRIQITTEAVGIYDVAAQLDCLQQVRPGWASISIREIARAPGLADRVYGACADMGCEVQHILYDTEDVALLQQWQTDGTVRPDQTSVLFVLGRYAAGQVSQPGELDAFLTALPDAPKWMLCAFGPQEHACLIAAMQRGGDARVGFENSLLRADGTLHADNASSVTDLIAGLTV